MRNWLRLSGLRRVLLALAALGLMVPAVTGQDDGEAPAKRPDAVGAFLTINSPVDEAVFGRVTNTALSLQSKASQQRKRGVLVLEITPGTSNFESVLRLARFLTSARAGNLTTVAWIPETVTGNNVVLALACNEIIMHPDAELGDIGRGSPLSEDERQDVLRLVERRHNVKVNRAIALAMLDPQQRLWRVQVRMGEDGVPETQFVTEEEREQLRRDLAHITSPQVVKEAGVVGRFSGETAQRLGMLTMQTAQTRQEVARIYDLPAASMQEKPTIGDSTHVQLIRIDDVIEPMLDSFVRRQIDRAIASGASLLIFEIESPGGVLLTSTDLAFHLADLRDQNIRTVAYIPRRALSGAAIIALGCDEIYMHPSAQIGDAEPIEARPGQQFEKVPAKVLSHLRTTLRALAEKKGRPPGLVEAMADQDLVVYEVRHKEDGRVWYMTEDEWLAKQDEWEKGNRVPESREGNLLTLDGRRAHALLLAEPPVNDLDELKDRLGIPEQVSLLPAGRTWVDTLVFVLNTPEATVLLFTVGAICLFLELHFMTGLLGILSALCFALFFWSRFLGGTAGYLELTLFLLGLCCLLLEIFVIPGFGVFGVSGALLVLFSLVMASQNFGNYETNRDFELLTRTLGTLSISVVAIIGVAFALNRFLPRMPIFDKIVLSPPGAVETADGPRLRPDLMEEGGQAYLIGQTGVAMSPLRPSGKIQIGETWVDVVSDGGFIPAGSAVEVVQVTGNRVVVRQV